MQAFTDMAVQSVSQAVGHMWQPENDHHRSKHHDRHEAFDQLFDEEPTELTLPSLSTGITFGSKLQCMACQAGVGAVDYIFDMSSVTGTILGFATDVCHLGQMINIVRGQKTFCEEIVHQFGSKLFPSLTHHFVTSDRVCDEHFGMCSQPVIEALNLESVVNKMLATKPASLANDNFINDLYAQIASRSPPATSVFSTDNKQRQNSGSSQAANIISAVHISDVHLDMEYEVGSLVNCDAYLCCRAATGYPSKEGDKAAGYWGDYECDMPIHTFANMLDFIASDVQPDMLFWTGDNSAHNVWDNTEVEITKYTIKVSQMLKEHLDTKKNVTILPIQGNHDTWPVDQQDFLLPNSNNPINWFKDEWAEWLGEEALAKFGEYGYYSKPIELVNGKQLPKGTRLIAWNTTVTDSLNYNIWGERNDPGHQFAWLEQ